MRKPRGYVTQHGIRCQFESTFVAQNLTRAAFAASVHPPQHLSEPFTQYMDYLQQSHSVVESLYQLEKDRGFTRKGSLEARPFTANRMAAGSQMLLNLWYTAWRDSVPTQTPVDKSK